MNISDLKINKILDLATGMGQFIPYLLSENKDIEELIGVDVCSKSIAQAEKNCSDPRVSFQIIDARSLPFSDNYFDGVAINNSLHHFENIEIVLAEAKRVLASDGYLIIHEMVSDAGQSPSQQSHIQIHHWFAELDSFMNRFHDYTFTSKTIESLISENGFEIIHKEIYDREKDNPRDEKLIQNYKNFILKAMEQAEKKNASLDFIKQGNRVLDHLCEYGYSPARNILLIAQKAGGRNEA